jgi:hypothetical protein
VSGVDVRYRKREQALGPERLIVRCAYSESDIIATLSCGHVDLASLSMKTPNTLRLIRGNWRMRCLRCAGEHVGGRPDSKDRDWFE